MKALSIRQPYAQVIKRGIKKIETRSWKTSYRGKLYIHASATKMIKADKNNTELMNLAGDEDKIEYGCILCECNLVDCVEMTEEFISRLKRENIDEYNSGMYSVGRYAWILEDVKPVSPISIKGSLGIWDVEKRIQNKSK